MYFVVTIQIVCTDLRSFALCYHGYTTSYHGYFNNSVSNDHGISGKMIKASYMQPSEYSKKFEGSEYLRDKLDR